MEFVAVMRGPVTIRPGESKVPTMPTHDCYFYQLMPKQSETLLG